MSAADDRLVKLVGARARARAHAVAAEAEALAHAPDTDVARTVERTLAALGAQRAASMTSAVVPSRPRGARRPRLGVRGGRWLAAIVPLAAAVALVVAAPWRARPAVTPGEYVVEVRGHVETERASPGASFATLEARDGSFQSVIVRPRIATHAPLAAKVLVVRGAVGAPLGVTPEASELGTFRVDIPGDALRGASEVRIVIAPRADLDEAASAAALSPPRSVHEAVVLRVPVEPPRPGPPEKN